MKLSKEQFEGIINECCKQLPDLLLKSTLRVLSQIVFNYSERKEFNQKYDKFENFTIKDENNSLFKASLNVNEDGSALFMFESPRFDRYMIKVSGLLKDRYNKLINKDSTEYIPILVYSYYDSEQKETKYYHVFLYNSAKYGEDKSDFRLDYVVSCSTASKDEENTVVEKQTSERLTKKQIKEIFVLRKPLTKNVNLETD